jgi:addiction module HigA family antidote
MQDFGLTKSEVAKSLGLTRGKVDGLLTGRARITASDALRLAKVLRTTPELWLNLQMNVDLWKAQNELKKGLSGLKPLKQLEPTQPVDITVEDWRKLEDMAQKQGISADVLAAMILHRCLRAVKL